MSNYYNKTWNEPDNHGTTFFKHVDFSAPNYKYQEQVFRDYIGRFRGNIKSVLELGAGTGRMTKIMLDELEDDLEQYEMIDIMPQKVAPSQSNPNLFIWYHQDDITKVEIHGSYDLILASEVFMHIKPEDIDKVIEKLSKIGKQIINIDWAFEPQESDWCFIHPYHDLYTKYGGKPEGIRSMKTINQALFHYRFD